MLVVQTLAGRISRQISASAQQQLGQSPGDKLEQTEGRNRAPLLFSTRAVPEPQTTSKDTACLSRCLLGWGAPKCELQAPSPGQVIPLQELPKDSEASKHCNSRTTLSFFFLPASPASQEKNNSSQVARNSTERGEHLSLDTLRGDHSGYEGKLSH